MNLDRHLIVGLLYPDDMPLTDRVRLLATSGHQFADTNSAVLSYILKHLETYPNRPPARETVEEKFPNFNFDASPEPYQFYLREAIELRKERYVKDNLGNIERILASGNIQDAMDAFIMSAREFESVDLNSQDVDVRAQVDVTMEEYRKRRESGDTSGIMLGLSVIDRDTNGVQPGDFWVIVARPRSFKTWLLCRTFAMVSQQIDGPVLFFSKEMTKHQIHQRVQAIVGGVSFSLLRRYKLDDEALDRIADRLRAFTAKAVIVGKDTRDRYDVAYIKSKIIEYSPKLALVDGLYMLAKDEDWKEQTTATRSIREISLDTGSPIIGTTQYARAKTGKTSTRRTTHSLDDLAYSDSYAQDASVVLGLERTFDEVLERHLKAVTITTLKVRDDEADNKMVLRVGFKESRFEEGDGPDLDSEDWQAGDL